MSDKNICQECVAISRMGSLVSIFFSQMDYLTTNNFSPGLQVYLSEALANTENEIGNSLIHMMNSHALEHQAYDI